MSDGVNLPEPKTRADRIAAKAIELLEQDSWLYVDNDKIVIRDVTFRRNDWKIQIPNQSADILRWESPSCDFRDMLSDAFSGAMSRKRIALTEPMETRITNDRWLVEKRAVRLREACRLIFKAMSYCAVILLVSIAFVGGITSCINHGSAERLADNNQVNQHGFRKGDINPKLKYPDDCARQKKSISRCRAAFEDWEERGEAWVTWGDPS